MQIQLIRSATLVVTLGGRTILVDPMLSPAGAMDPVANTPHPRRNPLVELPFDDAALGRMLAGIEAVLVTHTHRDHWDARAVELIPKQLPILCQPEDEAKIRGDGFEDVRPVAGEVTWEGIALTRTGGQHGTGEIGRMLAPVSGFVLRAAGEPVLYLWPGTRSGVQRLRRSCASISRR
jgi:L-ascorbate metabolism protein UlaG (beta-lactamase superfamily)